jgi:hypothetical protein
VGAVGEGHLRSSGEEPSHPWMKVLLTGFASAQLNKLMETKSALINFFDRRICCQARPSFNHLHCETAEKQATKQARSLIGERYDEGSHGLEHIYTTGDPGSVINLASVFVSVVKLHTRWGPAHDRSLASTIKNG